MKLGKLTVSFSEVLVVELSRAEPIELVISGFCAACIVRP
jgi:hypothetical protein